MPTRDTQTIQRQLNAAQIRLRDAEAKLDSADHTKSCGAHHGQVELLRAMANAEALLIDDKLAGIDARNDRTAERRANVALIVAAILMVSELTDRAVSIFRREKPPQTTTILSNRVPR